MRKPTVLRFLKASSPENLTSQVGSLPFKIEIKSIEKDGRSWVCFFTLEDSQAKISNEMIREMANG